MFLRELRIRLMLFGFLIKLTVRPAISGLGLPQPVFNVVYQCP